VTGVQKLVIAVVLALVLVIGWLAVTTSRAEAKVTYGPCIDYILYQWRESDGELGVGWMMIKMYYHCDANGEWNYLGG